MYLDFATNKIRIRILQLLGLVSNDNFPCGTGPKIMENIFFYHHGKTIPAVFVSICPLVSEKVNKIYSKDFLLTRDLLIKTQLNWSSQLLKYCTPDQTLLTEPLFFIVASLVYYLGCWVSFLVSIYFSFHIFCHLSVSSITWFNCCKSYVVLYPSLSF